MTALPAEADTREALAALEALLESRCFEMSREEWNRPKEGVHALALKDWWQEGGRAWVASYLELGRPGVRTVAMPPAVREVLVQDAVPPEHWLASVLCPSKEPHCGAETHAWHQCMEETFRRHRERERHRPLPGIWEPPDCVARALKKPKRWRYTAWRSCRDQRRSVWTLPIARLPAPTDGWFVLRGRRGHYSFCDDVRAYHLGTGAAYISERCFGMAPQADGGYCVVCCPSPVNEPRNWLRAGTLAPEKVRELTWALMLAAEASSLHQEAQLLTVPEGFPIEWRERDDDEIEGIAGGGVLGGMSSGHTRLDWSWFRPEGTALAGNFFWPTGTDPAEEHVLRLLNEAEATFAEGCPPLAPPRDALDFTAPTSHPSTPGGQPRELDTQTKELIQALRSWRPPAGCLGAPQASKDAGP